LCQILSIQFYLKLRAPLLKRADRNDLESGLPARRGNERSRYAAVAVWLPSLYVGYD